MASNSVHRHSINKFTSSVNRSENVERTHRRVVFHLGGEENSDDEGKLSTPEPPSLLDVLGAKDEAPWKKKPSSTQTLCLLSRAAKNPDEWDTVDGGADANELDNERGPEGPKQGIPIIRLREASPAQHTGPIGSDRSAPLHFTPLRGEQLLDDMATTSNNANTGQSFNERYALEAEQLNVQMGEQANHGNVPR
jgi:hypothetical protein